MKKQKTSRKLKDPNVYPPGWDYERTMAIARHYDAMKDKDVLKELASTGKGIGMVWMEIPQELVEPVRKLIARRQRSA